MTDVSRIKCTCGTVLWNGEVPNDIEYWAFSDKQLCEVNELGTVGFIELNNRLGYNIWRCPDCKRLFVYDLTRSDKQPVCVYKLEKENDI